MFPKYVILLCFWGDYSMFVFWVLQKTKKLQPTPLDDVVPGKEVPFGDPDDYILYLDL